MLEDVRGELQFELSEVDIAGDPELEAALPRVAPVVEIDGERAFVYYVPPDAFRASWSHKPAPLR